MKDYTVKRCAECIHYYRRRLDQGSISISCFQCIDHNNFEHYENCDHTLYDHIKIRGGLS